MLFFTWEQPFYMYVEMTAFFEDMKSVQDGPGWDQPPEREFCSPALVNAILALGSVSGLYIVPRHLKTSTITDNRVS